MRRVNPPRKPTSVAVHETCTRCANRLASQEMTEKPKEPVCSECRGTGWHPAGLDDACPACNGHGTVEDEVDRWERLDRLVDLASRKDPKK